MIKIIISGTSDGFYPRYATDGKLDDAVSQNLLDRRRFLSREADRLDKEGYCFQVLDNSGILFHKILLLYDGFGRDGFMMASLFLPKDEALTGKEIKEALDSIVRDYKTRTINGMANFDLDWSFVKQKADELNKKVQNVTWKKLSSNNDASCTALIKGADDMVADYFQYPNPLHRGFEGFGLVFLSEAILDPSKETIDGYQGYKVRTTEDVDIANPEYKIELLGQLQQNGSYAGKTQITKKELSGKGDIRIGTYSKSGYRSADVYIKGNEKVSKDNLTIEVTLPTLEEKRAVVEIIVIDKSKNTPIQNYNITIDWKTSHKTSKPVKQVDGKYLFLGECCDVVWEYTIKCGNLFDTHSGQIIVEDGKNITNEIALAPKPLWSIDYILPDGSISSYGNGGYPDDAIDIQTDAAKQWLKLMGYDTVKTNKDKKSNKVTLTCEKHIDEFGGYVTKPKEPSKTDEFSDGIDDRAIETDCKSLVPKRERFYLLLDSKSCNYLLFKNFRKKCEYANQISSSIHALEEDIALLKKARKVPKAINASSIIVTYLKDGLIDKAKNALETFPNRTEEGWELGKKIDAIIKNLEKHNRIPDVVVNPTDVVYNVEKHRLECERAESPSTKEPIKFGKDRYVYYIPNPVWQKEEVWNSNENVVNRKLLPKYNVMRFAIPIVAILAIVIIVICLRGNGESVKEYEQYKVNISAMLDNCNQLSYNEQINSYTRYIGDSTFNHLKTLYDNVNNFIKDNKELGDSIKQKSSYNDLEWCYNEQSKRREEERIVYDKCCQLLKSSDANLNDCQSLLNAPVLSKEHFDELNFIYNQKIDSLYEDTDKQAINNELNLYNKILSSQGTLEDGKKYMDTYSQVPMNGYTTTERMDDVKKKMDNMGTALYNKAMNDKLSKDECINACNRYIQFKNSFKGLSYLSQITARLRTLKTASPPPSPSNTEVNRSLTSSDEGKVQITTLSELFKKLNWDGVKGGVEAFDKKYSLNDNSLINDKNWIFTLVRNKNVKQGQYKNIYREIKKDSKINEVDKVNELAKRIQKIQ